MRRGRRNPPGHHRELIAEALRPTRMAAAERRQAVLDTACEVFSKRSYRGATTAEIAREAGVTEPILYRHFGSKRDLYLACLDQAWQDFRAVAEEAIATNPVGCLGAIADAYMKPSAKARIRLVDLWIQALTEAAEDEVIAKALREQIREVHDFFAELIRRSQAKGEVHEDRDAVAEAWIFIGGGLLATIDHRLGNLLGDDLQRVRTERRRWMLPEPS
jgi:AcrR family transcriptional regulator